MRVQFRLLPKQLVRNGGISPQPLGFQLRPTPLLPLRPSSTSLYPCLPTAPPFSIRSISTHQTQASLQQKVEAQVVVDGTEIAEEGEQIVDLGPKPRTGAQGGYEGEEAASRSKKVKSEEDPYDEELGLEMGEDGIVRGRLSSTNSHLLRLTLPLPSSERPCAFVLHPSQPLSYLARLIASEMSPNEIGSIEFKGFGSRSSVRWSDATDIGDFIKQAAQVRSFTITLGPPSQSSSSSDLKEIEVTVPSFEARTHFLQRRLRKVNKTLAELGGLKHHCDREARRGARRLAFSGMGGLLGYWVVVAYLTTIPSIGWDVMEPVTFLVSHGALCGAYGYWLYTRREPSNQAVLDRSISTRQAKLYAQHGFDLDRHTRLTREGVELREQIRMIAQEYGIDWEEKDGPNATGPRSEIRKVVRENEELEEKAELEGLDEEEARLERKKDERKRRAEEKKKEAEGNKND